MNFLRVAILAGMVICLAPGKNLRGSEGAPGDQQHRIAGIGIAAAADVPGHGTQRLREHVVVRQVIPDSPAEKIGLRAGDEIVEVDGTKLAGMKFAEAIDNHLRGPLGSPVEIKVMRPGQNGLLSFVIVRDIVPIPPKP